MEIVVDNRVRIRSEGLSKSECSILKRLFEHKNPEHAKKARMGIPTWNEPAVIRTWAEEQVDGEAWMTFPRGGFARVKAALVEMGRNVSVVDARENGVPVSLPDHKRELYEHQEEIVEAAIACEQCIVRAPTNSGKTSALIAIASRVGVPTLVVVNSRALLDQWLERVRDELGLRPKQIGIVGGGKRTLQPITLGIWKSVESAAEDPDFRRYFGAVIMDEVHLAAANSFFRAIDPMPARYRIGASADERRRDRKEFIIHDLFGEVAASVDRERLIESGHILDVEIRAVPTTFAAPWYGVPESEEDERKLDFVRLVQEMAEDPERNWLAVRLARDEVLGGNQVLVMAHEREHCMRLGQVLHGMGLDVGYMLGGAESRDELQRSIEGLKSGRLRIGVGTYKAIGTGIDIPKITVGIAVTPVAGNRQNFGQVRGRVRGYTHSAKREGMTTARLYVLLDELVYPRHVKNLAAWNNEVVVRDESGAWVEARQWIKRAG